VADIEKTSATNPIVTLTDRTVLVFGEDVSAAQLEQFRLHLAGLFDLGADDVAERTVAIPRLGVIVTPVPYAVLREERAVLGQFGIVAYSPERVSFLPRRNFLASRARVSPKTPLDVMGVIGSPWTGDGIGVAMLDTGFDRSHIDFRGRTIITLSSRVSGPVSDLDGHGTHTIGLACGSKAPANGVPRYGVASKATIISVRVFDDSGLTTDGELCRGIDLALANGAKVIGMCLGSGVPLNAKYSTAFETMAERVSKTAVLIAAAGDDPAGDVYPVSHPANCPAVMAIAGLDSKLRPSEFSCGERNIDGEVNLAAPSEDLLSSVPGDQHDINSGTSMSAAYVAGIAALWAEKGYEGLNLRAAVEGSFTPLTPRELVGNGLVQAPA
jgi:subtilisin family serine protease